MVYHVSAHYPSLVLVSSTQFKTCILAGAWWMSNPRPVHGGSVHSYSVRGDEFRTRMP
jgi:hypothetical protein